MPLTPTVAIVGRPNVGKSTLFNRLLGRRQAIVHDLPGITRDRITGIAHLLDDSPIQIVDTGGLVPGDDPLGLNEQVFLAVQESDLLLFVVDGKLGLVSADEEVWSHFRRFGKPTLLVVNKGDTREARNRFPEFYALGIDRQLLVSAEHAGTIWELGRAAVVAINKWDLLDDEGREKLEFSFQRLDELLASPGRVNVSALSGRGVDKLWGPIDRALDSYNLKLSTGQLNRLFERFIKKVAPPSLTGAPWKLYYVTQVSSAPPTVMLFANRTLPRNHHYRRYLENRLREELGLPGVPLRLVVRKRTE